MANPGEASPSVARPLSSFEVEQLVALGLAIPEGWVVTIDPPYGQLRIQPAAGRVRHHRCFVVDPGRRVISRDNAILPARNS